MVLVDISPSTSFKNIISLQKYPDYHVIWAAKGMNGLRGFDQVCDDLCTAAVLPVPPSEIYVN